MINASKVSIEFNFYNPDIKSIRECLQLLYTTQEGTLPYDRHFGLNQDFLSQPLPISKNMYALEVIEKTEIYENRIEVKEVSFEFNSELGQVIPHIILMRGVDENK